MTEASSLSATLFARLLCDVMIPAEVAMAIRTQGYDVAEARTLPVESQQDDYALLAEATQQQRVMITCSYSDPQSNFCLIHAEWQAQGKDHCGIVLIPQYQISSRLRRWEVRDRLLNFLHQHTADELRNQLWWLPQA
jgi:hypothetical protein